MSAVVKISVADMSIMERLESSHPKTDGEGRHFSGWDGELLTPGQEEAWEDEAVNELGLMHEEWFDSPIGS